MEGIPNEGSEDSNLEKSICIDDVIFYGPITAKERIIRERFERRQKEKAALRLLPPLIDIGEQLKDNREEKINAEESKNEITTDVSIYESFSIDESKYESFDDSLDEGKNIYPNETNINFLSDQVNVNVRKLRANKMLKGSLCDSLEDIHSLVSNVEKLSISEEIESINVREKNHIYDDSLKNDICFENKNTSSNEQNFDEDSLAILELEKTFDDSLEEADILPLTHIDNLIILKNSKSETEISVENLSKENTCVTKNLFETSVQIIYENVRNDVEISEDQNYGIKQVSSTGDSLSISENMSKDSLEDLPVISKGKELQEELKNSESVILNNVKSDFLTNLGKIECINKTEMCEVTDLNPVIASNLSCIPFDFDNELSVHVNVSNSNNAILIEDSFELSSETSFSKKEQLENKLLINENIMKGVSSAINETIWIDDSFIEPHPVMNKNKTYSFNNEKSEKEKSDCDKQILSEINEYENFKKGNTEVVSSNADETIYIDDSVNTSYEPMLEIKKTKNSSEKNVSCSVSLVKEPYTPKESYSKAKIYNSNNTICLEDSPVCLISNIKKEESSSNKKLKDVNFNSKIKALSPVKDERFHNAKGKIFEAKTPNCGVESFISLKNLLVVLQKVKRPSTDKIHTFHNETELDQVKMKVNNTNEKHIISHKSSHSVSPPDKVQKAAIVNAVKSPVDESIKYNLPDITSVLPKHLTKETNSKIQPEVAFDENQSANTISISAIDQQNQNKQSSINEIDGMKETIELKHKTCDTYENIDIYKSSESWELDLNHDAIFDLINNPIKKKSEIMLQRMRFAYLQAELNIAFDPQLLKALDLHDTLYNRINNAGYIQSRSSIEPLNLCFRDIGFKSEKNPCLIETESKENIPTLYSSESCEKEAEISNSSKKDKRLSLKTPKHINYNADVKKSGGKGNSATKIPVRKVDGMFPTPVHRKIRKDNKPISCEKPRKSPLVKCVSTFDTLSCLKAEETPRKHHFCTIRNSISRVPKSAPRFIPKKFQNIESPIAKYIGNPQSYTPLKVTYKYDGNHVFSNSSKTPKCTVKTPTIAFKGPPKCPSTQKDVKRPNFNVENYLPVSVYILQAELYMA